MNNCASVNSFVRRLPKETLLNMKYVIVYFESTPFYYAYYKLIKPIAVNVVLNDDSIKHLTYVEVSHLMHYGFRNDKYICIHEKVCESIDYKSGIIYKLVISKDETDSCEIHKNNYTYFIKEITNEAVRNRVDCEYNDAINKENCVMNECCTFNYNDEDEKFYTTDYVNQ